MASKQTARRAGLVGAIVGVAAAGIAAGVAAERMLVRRSLRVDDPLADEPFGEQRLQDFLLASAALSADQVASAALDRLGTWVGYAEGRTQEDDLTVLVVDL